MPSPQYDPQPDLGSGNCRDPAVPLYSREPCDWHHNESFLSVTCSACFSQILLWMSEVKILFINCFFKQKTNLLLLKILSFHLLLFWSTEMTKCCSCYFYLFYKNQLFMLFSMQCVTLFLSYYSMLLVLVGYCCSGWQLKHCRDITNYLSVYL